MSAFTVDMQDTAQAEFFTLCTIRARLKVELVGMTSKQSTLALLNTNFNKTFKRKRPALEWVQAEIERRKGERS